MKEETSVDTTTPSRDLDADGRPLRADPELRRHR